MKSLRKIVLMAGALLLAGPSALLEAQQPQPGAGRAPAVQGNESLRAIVAALSLNDEAFVCRFDQFFHPGKGFTSDQDKLLTELKRTRLDDEPSVGPTSPAINNGPTINGRSATGDAPNI